MALPWYFESTECKVTPRYYTKVYRTFWGKYAN